MPPDPVSLNVEPVGQGWGAKVIERLVHDLHMAFFKLGSAAELVQAVLAPLPCYHPLVLLGLDRSPKN